MSEDSVLYDEAGLQRIYIEKVVEDSFIQQSIYMLNIYHMPDTIVSAGDMALHKTDKNLTLLEFTFK